MKRFLTTSLSLLALLFIACEGPEGPAGRDGKDGNEDIISITLSAASSDWTEFTDDAGKNRYYACSFNVPEITKQNDVVLCYVVLNNAQQILPYVRHFEDAEGNMWTRTTDFEYSVGKVSVFVTNSDFFQEIPSQMTFRLVVIPEK